MTFKDHWRHLAACGASAEAIEKLEEYVRLIQHWNRAINLVAPGTLEDIWERHIVDSAQLWPIIKKLPNHSKIIDLGSGGGLPGLVLAFLGAERMVLIESDTRKAVFLREVPRETNLTNVTVVNNRIENVNDIKAPVVTARALASLESLIELAHPLLEENGTMIFLKGADVENEIKDLTPEWQNKVKLVDSMTDKKAKIVIIRT